MKWLCNHFAQSYVNDCAIKWFLACMNVVVVLVWLAKICAIIYHDCAIKLCKHMNWLCNVKTPICTKHIEHPPSGYTLNMEASKAWLSKICAIIKWLCIHIVQAVWLCSVQRPIWTKQSEHPPCSYTSGWNIENINVITDGQFITLSYKKGPV